MVKLITILLKIYFNIKQEEINIVFYFEVDKFKKCNNIIVK